MTPAQFHPEGTRLAGKFRVIRLLGSGGMGAVYEVENERLAKRYALKVLHPDEQTSPEVIKRFQREIKADGQIRNEHIVEVHDDGVLETGEPFVVMELLEGETLASFIKRKGQLDLAEMGELIGQACAGVQAAHEAGIIHRDLKPENLFITYREGKPFIKLLDFGIAKFQNPIADNLKSTSKGAILGTPYYLSPEQIRGNVEIDVRVDVYALGVILYECATGRVPYRADTLPLLGVLICEGNPEPLGKLRPDLPEDFRHCVLQAMAIDRERRIPNARDLGAALRAMGKGGPLASASMMSTAASTSSLENPPVDLMRTTEMIEEPLDLPLPPPIQEREQQPALERQRPFPWVLIAAFALLGVGVGGIWIQMKPSSNPMNLETSSIHSSAPRESAKASPPTASSSAPVVENEVSPQVTENARSAPSASTSARVLPTSTAKTSVGPDRASKLGINGKLPP